ncbi:UvrB/UvrC motif-containing protein [Bacillota bacterium LX-D]|nr:UvrB/UvrC motif-containing protein [Bacillota bacterium LX-D]
MHITKIVNQHKTELDLCEECASMYQQEWSGFFEPTFSINNLLASILSNDPQIKSSSNNVLQGKVCPLCGQHYAHFAQTGKLGCDHCYESFSNGINPLLRRVQGSQTHKGKIPKRIGGSLKIQKELQDLRYRLQGLILNEEFEEAAEVRDKIKELEKKLRGKEKGVE